MDVHCPCYHLVNPSPLAWAVVTLGISNKRSKGSSRQGCGHGQAKFIMAWEPQPPCPRRHKSSQEAKRCADTPHCRHISSKETKLRLPIGTLPASSPHGPKDQRSPFRNVHACVVHSQRAEQRAERAGHQCWLPPDGVTGNTPDGGGGCWLWTGDWKSRNFCRGEKQAPGTSTSQNLLPSTLIPRRSGLRRCAPPRSSDLSTWKQSTGPQVLGPKSTNLRHMHALNTPPGSRYRHPGRRGACRYGTTCRHCTGAARWLWHSPGIPSVPSIHQLFLLLSVCCTINVCVCFELLLGR